MWQANIWLLRQGVIFCRETRIPLLKCSLTEGANKYSFDIEISDNDDDNTFGSTQIVQSCTNHFQTPNEYNFQSHVHTRHDTTKMQNGIPNDCTKETMMGFNVIILVHVALSPTKWAGSWIFNVVVVVVDVVAVGAYLPTYLRINRCRSNRFSSIAR